MSALENIEIENHTNQTQQLVSKPIYDKIIHFIIHDLYLNKNTTRDIAYYKGLGQRVARFCKYNNIVPELFFKQCNIEIKKWDLNFIQYITKIEIEIILEAKKISNKTNNKLRSAAQKIIDKKYILSDLNEAIELVRKIKQNIDEKNAKILWFQLWNLYITLWWRKSY